MKNKCSKCMFWNEDKTFGLHTSKIEKRIIGFCFLYPPVLMQNIVPAIIREKGLSNIKEHIELFQFRPMTTSKCFCKEFKKIKKKKKNKNTYIDRSKTNG